ncbi:MAG: hypothetical protein HYY06_19625 [Deltaproteobacteria bacterium]|nr:hypothetical protein [Deltaproteobacteria bacterium]
MHKPLDKVFLLALLQCPLVSLAQPAPQPQTSDEVAGPELEPPPPGQPGDQAPQPPPGPTPAQPPPPTPAPPPPPVESETERASLPSEGGSGFVPEGRWFDRLGSGDPIFEIRNDPFSLALHGLLQVQAAPYVQRSARKSNGDAADVEGFLLRRARLGIDGSLIGGVTYALQYEFFDGAPATEEGGSRLLDATIGYERFPLLQMSFGAQKVPFSKVAITSTANLQLIERPFSSRQLPNVLPLVPDRQVGAVISGDLIGAAEYSVGVFNGNETMFRGDDNGGLLYAARLELHPLGTTGESQAAFFPIDEGYRRIRVALGGDIYFNDDAAGTQLAWSADLTLKWRGLSVTAEWLMARFEPSSDPVRPPELIGEVDQRAFFAQAGFFVIPGRVEIAARFEDWDTNTDVDDASDLQAISGALSLYLLRDRIKAQLQYTHRREPNAAEDLRNDTGVLQLQAKF